MLLAHILPEFYYYQRFGQITQNLEIEAKFAQKLKIEANFTQVIKLYFEII